MSNDRWSHFRCIVARREVSRRQGPWRSRRARARHPRLRAMGRLSLWTIDRRGSAADYRTQLRSLLTTVMARVALPDERPVAAKRYVSFARRSVRSRESVQVLARTSPPPAPPANQLPP